MGAARAELPSWGRSAERSREDVARPSSIAIGGDARPVLEPPPAGAGPEESAQALCSALGPLLGTVIAVQSLTTQVSLTAAEDPFGEITLAEVTLAEAIGESGPAEGWTVVAAAAEITPAAAAQRAVVAALLGEGDLLTAAMQRFVWAGSFAGGIVVVGDDQPLKVGETDDPGRLLELVDVVPAATMIGVRTDRRSYGAFRTRRHACGWQWTEDAATPLGPWFRAWMAADVLGNGGSAPTSGGFHRRGDRSSGVTRPC